MISAPLPRRIHLTAAPPTADFLSTSDSHARSSPSIHVSAPVFRRESSGREPRRAPETPLIQASPSAPFPEQWKTRAAGTPSVSPASADPSDLGPPPRQ